MARALTFKSVSNITWSYTNAQDLSTPTDAKAVTYTDTNLTGSSTSTGGKDIGDRLWHDSRTLAATTSEEIDMYDLAVDGGSAGEDTLGQAVTSAVVKYLKIRNKSTTVGDDLHVGGEASVECWNSVFNSDDDALIVVGPGGSITLEAPAAAGYAVADSGNDLLKINNPGSNSVTYEIIVVFATSAS